MLGRTCGSTRFKKSNTSHTLVCIRCDRAVIYSLCVKCAVCHAAHPMGEGCHDCACSAGATGSVVPLTRSDPRAEYARALSVHPAEVSEPEPAALSASLRPEGASFFTEFLGRAGPPPAGFTLNPDRWYVYYLDGGCRPLEGQHWGPASIGIVLEEHLTRPDPGAWGVGRERYIFKCAEFISRFGVSDVAEFCAMVRAHELHAWLMPDGVERGSGNVWAPFFRFDKESELFHFHNNFKLKMASISPQLYHLRKRCYDIQRREGFTPFVDDDSHVPGHADSILHAVQGEVNLVADKLATHAIMTRNFQVCSDRVAVLWRDIVSEHMPWYRPQDGKTLWRRKATHYANGVGFVNGEYEQVRTDIEIVDANPFWLTVARKWPWSLAEGWFLHVVNGSIHPDFVPSAELMRRLDNVANAPSQHVLSRWDRCFVPTRDSVHPSAREPLCEALSACMHVAVFGETMQRRGAGLLVYQLLPRLCLRTTSGTETTVKLLATFHDGDWAELWSRYHTEAVRHACAKPDRYGARDLDAHAPPVPMATLHDTPRPTLSDAPAPNVVYERVLTLVRKGRRGEAAKVLCRGERPPYSASVFGMLENLQYQPHASTRADMAALREEAPGFCTQAVRDDLCISIAQNRDDNGIDTSDRGLVFDRIATASEGTAGGPSGHYLDYVRMMGGDRTAMVMLHLALLVSFIANGGLLQDGSYALIMSAVAMALLKGAALAMGIRPLAIGEPLRRLVGGIILSKYTHRDRNVIAEALLPHQFAIGLPGGLDIMFNIVRLALGSHPDWIVLGSDIRSAFQRAVRARFLKILRHHPTLQPMYPFAATCYMYGSTCFFGELFSYTSAEGSAQGCPFGTFTFAVGIDPDLRAVAAAIIGVLILCFADDLVILGPPDLVAKAYAMLDQRFAQHRSAGPEGSLAFCLSKTWVYSMGEGTLAALDRALFPEGTEWVPTSSGIKLLGCFASTNVEWLSATSVAHFAQRHTPLHDALRAFVAYASGPCLQCAALVAASCASTRLTHFVRLVSPMVVRALVADHSRRMLTTLSHFLGGDALCMLDPAKIDSLSPLHRLRVRFARLQCALPISMGGLGWVPLALIHPAAFVAAWISTLRFLAQDWSSAPLLASLTEGVKLNTTTVLPLRELREAWGLLSGYLGGREQPLLDPKAGLNVESFAKLALCKRANPQHTLTSVIGKQHYEDLCLSAPTNADRIRLVCAAGAGAGLFLNASPSHPALELQDWEMRVALLLRLGLPLECYRDCGGHKCGEQHVCDASGMPLTAPRVCNRIPDPYGHHDFSCNSVSKWPRHEAIVSFLLAAGKRAGVDAVASSSECTKSLRDLCGLMQGDVVFRDYRGIGLHAHLDATCIHPVLPSYECIEYRVAGDGVALVRARKKRKLYDPLLGVRGHVFMVFGTETYGAVCKDGIRFFNDFIARPYAANQGLSERSARGQRVMSAFRTQAFTELSLAIARENAQIVRRGVAKRNPSKRASLMGLLGHGGGAGRAGASKHRTRRPKGKSKRRRARTATTPAPPTTEARAAAHAQAPTAPTSSRKRKRSDAGRKSAPWLPRPAPGPPPVTTPAPPSSSDRLPPVGGEGI